MTFPTGAFDGEEEAIVLLRAGTDTFEEGIKTEGSRTEIPARAVVRPIDVNQVRKFEPEASITEQHYSVLSTTVILPTDRIEFSERSDMLGRVIHCDDNQRHGKFTRAYVTITQTFGG